MRSLTRNNPVAHWATPGFLFGIKPTIRILTLLAAILPHATQAYYPEDFEQPVERIAFGSCNRTTLPQWQWDRILALKPDLWIWLGDNVYGKDFDAEDLRTKYRKQFNLEPYREFRTNVPVVGTWDDHDYGINDGHAEHPYKEKAQQWLLDFLEEPEKSPRREQEGVYTSYRFGPKGRDIRLILLDTRYNSSEPGRFGSILGYTQWHWLERELNGPHSLVTLIASSIQVVPTEHRYEKWENYPRERQRLFTLLNRKQVPNVVFLSGDRHFSEFSRIETVERNTPIWEFTSSSLTHPWTALKEEPNAHRIGDFINQPNFGWIEIDYDAGTLVMEVHTRDNGVAARHEIKLKR